MIDAKYCHRPHVLWKVFLTRASDGMVGKVQVLFEAGQLVPRILDVFFLDEVLDGLK